jgi:hypothetical protein
MKTYLVGYDLNKPGQDYADLIKEIRAYPDWWHYLDSTWIIKTDWTAKQIRDDLKPHIDPSDELLVVLLGGEGAWTGFKKTASEWLLENL